MLRVDRCRNWLSEREIAKFSSNPDQLKAVASRLHLRSFFPRWSSLPCVRITPHNSACIPETQAMAAGGSSSHNGTWRPSNPYPTFVRVGVIHPPTPRGQPSRCLNFTRYEFSRIKAGASPLKVIVNDFPRMLWAALRKPTLLPAFRSNIGGRNAQSAPGPRTPFIMEQDTFTPLHTAEKLIRVGIVGSSPMSVMFAPADDLLHSRGFWLWQRLGDP